MHHIMVVKVHAETAEEAKNTVDRIMEDSISDGDGNNRGRWDYKGDVQQIVLKNPKNGQRSVSEWNVSTFEELEKLLRPTKKTVPDNLLSLKRELFKILAPRFLSGKEAVTYLGDDSIDQDMIIKLIQGTHPLDKYPESFSDLVDLIAEIIDKECDRDGMLPYYVKRLDEERAYINRILRSKKKSDRIRSYDDACVVFDCYDAVFAEVWCDGYEGKNVFFFVTDRHF